MDAQHVLLVHMLMPRRVHELQVASSQPGGPNTVVSLMYPPVDEGFRRCLRDVTRACTMIAATVDANRWDEGSTGSMHGSGQHMRFDGFVAPYASSKLLDRKRRRGTERDQGSARGMARKVLKVWAGDATH